MKRMYSWILLLFMALPLCLYGGEMQIGRSYNLTRGPNDYVTSRFNILPTENVSDVEVDNSLKSDCLDEDDSYKIIEEIILRTVASYNTRVEDFLLRQEEEAIERAKKEAKELGPIYNMNYDYVYSKMHENLDDDPTHCINFIFGNGFGFNINAEVLSGGLNYRLSVPKSSIVWDNSVLLKCVLSNQVSFKGQLYTGIGTFLSPNFGFCSMSGGLTLEWLSRNNLLYVLPSTKIGLGFSYYDKDSMGFVLEVDVFITAIDVDFMFSTGIIW